MQSEDNLNIRLAEIARVKLQRLDQVELDELMAANGSFKL